MFASVHMNQNPIFSKTFQTQEYIDVWPQGTGVHWVTNSCCLLSFSSKFTKVLWCLPLGKEKEKGLELGTWRKVLIFTR